MHYVYIIKLSFYILDGHLESAFGKFVLWVSIISTFLKFIYTQIIVHVIG